MVDAVETMRRLARMWLMALWCAVLVLFPRGARAEPGDEVTVSVLTMSPGEPVFFKFGHIAVLVQDARTGRDEVFNWGTFTFDEPGLVTKFLLGRLTYWLSVQSLRGTLWQYDSENRSVVAQELNLTATQKLSLVSFVRNNARPENRKYRYHYYRDNCSTRVRDVVDRATGGALRAVSSAPASMTFRDHTLRLTADAWWAYIALNLAMGSYIDQPIAEWDEMFVPGRVQELLRKTMTRNAEGALVPLVKSERVLVPTTRAAPLARPPGRKLVLMLAGALVGSLLGWLAYRFMSSPIGIKSPVRRRLALAIPLSLGTFAAGFCGIMFLFFWTMTDHEVAYHNENLLQSCPIAMAMPVVAVGLLGDWNWARKAFVGLTVALASLSVLGLVLKAFPWWFRQCNGESIALLLPVWVGLAVGTHLGRRGIRWRDRGAVEPQGHETGASPG